MKGWAKTTYWSPPEVNVSTEMDWNSRDFSNEKSETKACLMLQYESKIVGYMFNDCKEQRMKQ